MFGAWSAVQGLVLSLVMAGAVVVVTGDAVQTLWSRGDHVYAVVSGVLLPITFIVWPWEHTAFGVHLWIVFAAGVVAESATRAFGRATAYSVQ